MEKIKNTKIQNTEEKKPALSVIIATHNSEEYIVKCLMSLENQTFPQENFEVIVVDDGSSDNSVEICKKMKVKIIETSPCSLAQARNIGVKNSSSEFLAFFDSDCEAESNWVSTIVKELKNFDAITGPIKNGNPNSPNAWAEYFVEFGGFHEFKKRKIFLKKPQ